MRKSNRSRPRLSVFRSSKHIYAQVIDDESGRTLAAASTLEKDLREQLKTGADRAAAEQVGKRIAERAKAAGVEAVVFDRGGYLYHGRVKARGRRRARRRARASEPARTRSGARQDLMKDR